MLTNTENKAIVNMTPIYREFIEAKFKPRLSVYSSDELGILVKELIIDILDSAGVKDRHNQGVKDYITTKFTEDLQHPKFASLTFEEVELALKKGVRQEYGAFMGVNIQTVNSWLKAYLSSKDRETAIKEFYSKASEIENGKEDKMSIPNPAGQAKVLEALKSIIKAVPKEEEKKQKLIKTSKEKTARDRYIQSCFMEFYQLWLKKPYIPPMPKPVPGVPGLIRSNEIGGKFILYEVTELKDGKLVTRMKEIEEVEYTEIKLAEYDKNNKA